MIVRNVGGRLPRFELLEREPRERCSSSFLSFSSWCVASKFPSRFFLHHSTWTFMARDKTHLVFYFCWIQQRQIQEKSQIYSHNLNLGVPLANPAHVVSALTRGTSGHGDACVSPFLVAVYPDEERFEKGQGINGCYPGNFQHPDFSRSGRGRTYPTPSTL